MRKKILYVITKGNFGGAQRYVFDLATRLPKEQFEVTVAMGNGGALENKLTEKNIETARIPSLQRDIHVFNDISTFWEIFYLLRLERPDIVHFNSSKAGLIGTIAARAASLYTKNYSPKIIFTGHGWAFNEERPALSKLILGAAHYVTILASHTTIAVADHIKKQLGVIPYITKRITTIHNGIEMEIFLSKKDAREKLGLPQDATILGTISELHKNKGIDFALRAFAYVWEKYPDAYFVIIGEGEERKSLIKLTHELGIHSRVLFLGYIPNAAQFLKAFDIFTLTSRTEALPYVLLEAGLANLPVIASRVGGIPEIIDHQISGLLSYPGDSNDIEHKMKLLLSDETKRSEYAQKLHKKVTTEFSLEKMIEKTIGLYK